MKKTCLSVVTFYMKLIKGDHNHRTNLDSITPFITVDHK